MKKELMNLFMVLAICFVAYFLFRKMNYKEGMSFGLDKTESAVKKNTSSSSSSSASSSSTNGIAGDAASYAATTKAATIKLQDTLLISKYSKDYETAILNLDDLINSLMLQTALSIDHSNPYPTITKLATLNQSKDALNSVMKYVDSQ